MDSAVSGREPETRLTAPSHPRPWRWTIAPLLLVALAAGLLGAESFQRKLDAFQPLGFQAVSEGDHWAVRSVADPIDEGLRPGDRIVLVDGVEVPRITDLRQRLRERPETRMVVVRGEGLEDVRYLRPGVDLDLPYLVLAFAGIAYFAIGLFTLTRTGGGAVFFGWCLASAALYVLSPVYPVDEVGQWIFLGDELARIFLPPLTLHLFLSVPRGRGERLRRLLPFAYLPATLLAALQADLALAGGRFVFGRPSAAALALLDRLELAQLIVFGAAAVIVLATRLRAVTDWEQHRQLLWLLVGMAAGYGPFFAIYGLPQLAGLPVSEAVAAIAVVPLIAVPVAFAYAILRYRLWDLGLIVRNGLSYGLTVLVALASFGLLDLAIRRGIPEPFAVARNLLTFFGGLVIAAIVVPAHRGIHGVLERLQYGRSFGRRRSLQRLGQDLLRERDLDRLLESLLSELAEGLDLGKANLYLAQGTIYVAVRPEAELPPSIARETIPERLWDGEFEALVAEAPPGEPTTLEQRLYAAGYRYAFPLEVRGGRVGLVLTSLRRDGRPLDSEDVEIVRTLLDPAALAIENAQLLDQVQRQLERVIALQQHNEGILESSPAGIALLDPEGRVISANLAFAALAGVARGDLLGRRLSELIAIPGLPEPGGGIAQVECRDGLGRERHLQVSLAPLQGGERFGQRVLVLQDVSERVAMESALKEKDRLASLGVLAAGVAHEVNTPLTGISSYAQLLLAETDETDPRHDLLRKVERQTFRASRIVSGLLEFARKPGRERRPLDLGELVSETVELLRERLSAKQVRLSWVPPEAGSVTVVGSEGELQQVFTNLVLNAIDAMAPGGGGEIALRLESAEGRVLVHVDDTGPGLRPEHLDRIFEPFFTTKRDEGGTGLGLSISQNIVEQHGGRITARNRATGGCRFTVELPVAGREAPRD